MGNRYYKLFTKQEIPDSETRRAVNCFYATMMECDKVMMSKCRATCFNLWRKCPKRTGKKYREENNAERSIQA